MPRLSSFAGEPGAASLSLVRPGTRKAGDTTTPAFILPRTTNGAPPYGCTVIALITTGVVGTLPCAPCAVVRTPAMASTTSIPSVTSPKTA